jgi:methyltransferase
MVKKTRVLFVGVVAMLAVQRLAELRLSRRNEQWILAQGGREHAPGHFGAMKTMHMVWFVSMLAEVFLLKRSFHSRLAVPVALVAVMGQGLRYAAIRTLDRRWTVRILTLPDAPRIDSGIYRYLRHPNYVGVALEIFAIPLLHTAYLTSFLFTLANAAVLFVRIRSEEDALKGGNSRPKRGAR